MKKFSINPDITRAETFPAEFYRSDTVFDLLKDKVFLKSWQWIGDTGLLPLSNYTHPFTLLDNYLTEPLVLTKNSNDEISCLSNVCTQRGNQVVHNPGKAKKMVCMYHGRRFDLAGNFEFMPEFKDAKEFPRPCEGLPNFPLEQWGPFLFTALEPSFSFRDVLQDLDERIGFLPLDQFKFDSSRSKDYLVNAHWALYCDNYLEGFHIPFVHNDLNAVLDYGSYETVLYDYANLQIGYSDSASETFDLPKGHIDYGKQVAAYYFWVFPNMMFNFYPWGLSINIVRPITKARTKVSFLTYIFDESKLEKGAGALLDKVEREDEFVVEGVQKGVSSRYYKAGRFSPTREQGVHHFQRLLTDFLNA
jgi:choline monooxygenase